MKGPGRFPRRVDKLLIKKLFSGGVNIQKKGVGCQEEKPISPDKRLPHKKFNIDFLALPTFLSGETSATWW
jgi:hypothetical protein